MDPFRLMLADDHPVLLDGLAKLLEPYCQIVALAHNGRQAVEQALELKPDVAVVDISMPLLNGIEVTRRIRELSPATRVVVLTMHSDREYLRAALNAGATGYVLKQSLTCELMHCLEIVMQGQVYISAALAGSEPRAETGPDGLFGRALTPRQREVLQLVAEGKSAKEIGSLLNISVKTVEFHKASIVSALGLRTTAELTRYAVEQGMVSVHPVTH
jgi:DNA-binding NarL/FixJ family response regulator